MNKTAEAKPVMHAIDTMTTKQTFQVQNHLNQMRFAILKAQTDFAHALMVEPGATQEALQTEIVGFMRDAQAHFVELKKLLIKQ